MKNKTPPSFNRWQIIPTALLCLYILLFQSDISKKMWNKEYKQTAAAMPITIKEKEPAAIPIKIVEPIIEEESEPLPFVETIPNSKNGRMPQPSKIQLHQIGRSGLYKKVIRLNGDGEDGIAPNKEWVSIAEERKILARYGVELIEINAHAKGAAEKIAAILAEGGVLIHCKHGFDRTGAMVAYYLSQRGYSQEQIIAHNRWENYIETKGEKYLQYYQYALAAK